jgi:hypothetical protein
VIDVAAQHAVERRALQEQVAVVLHRQADPAMELDRVLGDGPIDAGCMGLQRAQFGQGGGGIGGAAPEQRLGRRQPGLHVGDPVL